MEPRRRRGPSRRDWLAAASFAGLGAAMVRNAIEFRSSSFESFAFAGVWFLLAALRLLPRRRRIATMIPWPSREVKEIVEHLTDAELVELDQLNRRYLRVFEVCFAVPLGVPVVILVISHDSLDLAFMVGLVLAGLMALVFHARKPRYRRFLASTEWAVSQGITERTLRL